MNYFYYDEVGVRTNSFLTKELGPDRGMGESSVTTKTKPFSITIPRTPIKVGGSYTATINHRDGSITNKLSATASLWSRMTGTITVANPKGKYGVSSTFTLKDLPYPGLVITANPAPWGSSAISAKYHSESLGVVSAIKKSAGKPVFDNAFLFKLPSNFYFGAKVGLSLLKMPFAKKKLDYEDDDDDVENGVDDNEEEEEENDEKSKLQLGVIGSAKRCVSQMKKSVNCLDGFVSYAVPDLEVKGYITNFGKIWGVSLFKKISNAWSVAGAASLDRRDDKKSGSKKVLVEAAARYVAKSGSVIKVKGNSDSVAKVSYSAKFSECMSALFYGSINKKLNKNVGFSLVFTK